MHRVLKKCQGALIGCGETPSENWPVVRRPVCSLPGQPGPRWAGHAPPWLTELWRREATSCSVTPGSGSRVGTGKGPQPPHHLGSLTGLWVQLDPAGWNRHVGTPISSLWGGCTQHHQAWSRRLEAGVQGPTLGALGRGCPEPGSWLLPSWLAAHTSPSPSHRH